MNHKIKKPLFSYIYSILFTGLTLFTVLYILKIYPFGDETYLWTDADQYLAIEHYFGTILGKNDIFYSWCNTLGGNALPQLAYYALSPFNILFILFNDNMMFAAHLVVYLKIITSALTFCICINYFFKDSNNIVKALFATSYAFMGYMVFYGWNPSWMDGVIFLPIMTIGIHKIINGKSILIYILSLSIALISNFYIGFMLCIVSVIFYISIICLLKTNFWACLKSTFFKYCFASLLCGGFSAFILIPTYFGLPNARKSRVLNLLLSLLIKIFNKPYIYIYIAISILLVAICIFFLIWYKKKKYKIKKTYFLAGIILLFIILFLVQSSYKRVQAATILSGLFTGQINSLNQNAPLIFISIVPVYFIILFFISSKISTKEKFIAGGIVLIFLFSFQFIFLNVVWHGFTNEHWFLYRYSFLLSFVLLIVAYKSYILLKQNNYKCRDYIIATIVFLAIAFYVYKNANEKLTKWSFICDLLLVCVFLLLFLAKFYNNKLFTCLLSFCIIFSLVSNNYFTHKAGYSSKDYNQNKELIENATKTINDNSFYRMEKWPNWSRCEGNLFSYRGITNFSSSENVNNVAFLKKIGSECPNYLWSKYTPEMSIASESILGFKYLLTNCINSKDYQTIGNYNDITYYKNNYALPILFPVSTINDFDIENLNGFDVINSIYKSINNKDEQVFNSNKIQNLSNNNQLKLAITIKNTGSAYLCIPYGTLDTRDNTSTNIDVTAGQTKKTITYTPFQELYYLGEFNLNDVLELNFQTSNVRYNLDKVACSTENKNVVKTNSEIVKSQNVTINEIKSSQLEMQYSGNDKIIATTIPYDEGWSVYDNGQKIDIQKNWSNFIAFNIIDANDHKIELIYRPPGFYIGLGITVLTLILFLSYMLFQYRKSKCSKHITNSK